MDARLVKWGNSQAVRVPKEACDELGIKVGDRGSMTIDVPRSRIVITFDSGIRRFRRRSTKSLEELAQDWQGGRVGEEWGGPDVGSEQVA